MTSTNAAPTVSSTEKLNGAGGGPSGPPAHNGRDAPAEVDAWAFDRSLIAQARAAIAPTEARR